ncbi:DUF6382 domain-containing protein [Paenibacillus flagellatus]|uniref:FHA domain-containing protein n=1 Tax=Paenibacillus flagellatus TaxID=2211139 RepID=A0A2V5KCI3_9BACL|nr:DUF6382 domain-containing protein [Paenibacillus flagellatus]PYI55874.1 hypothetical protein DLM86_09170 [Paenibacillus flagellatus]
MDKSLYGFRCDFIRHRGTSLVLSGERPLHADELERIELRMMEANDIPGLLALDVEEIDLTVRLRYNMTGMKMLSHWMKTERLTLRNYYRMLLEVAGTIDGGRSYMLREEGYWLHEDFVFVDEESGNKLSLLYVPSHRTEGKPALRDQFKELSLRLSACIDTIEGGGFSSLMSMLHRDRFDFRDVKRKLAELLQPDGEASFSGVESGLSFPIREPTVERSRPQQALPSWIGAGPKPPNDRRSVPADDPEALWKAANERDLRLSNRTFADGEEEDGDDSGDGEGADAPARKNDAAPPAKQRLLIGAVAGSLLLLLWSFYPTTPAEGTFHVWTGLTVLLLDAVYVWIRLRPGMKADSTWGKLAKSYEAMEEREMTGLTGCLPVRAGTVHPLGKPSRAPDLTAERASFAVVPPRTSTPPFSASSSSPAPSDRYAFPAPAAPLSFAGRPDEGTGPLRPPDATVLLRPNGATPDEGKTAGEERESEAFPELEIAKGGETNRFRLKEERFVVGRERSAVDYADDSAGVSKLHAEVGRDMTGYYAKDLGSKNGTMLNGEPMVPYKRYPLQDGDTMQIVRLRLVFRAETTNTPS